MTSRLAPFIAGLSFVAALVDPGAVQDGRATPGEAATRTGAANALVGEAFLAAYNLDHDEAIRQVRRAVAIDPDNSAAHRGLAAILWQKILFQRGAMTVDHYLGSITKSQVTLPKPDPALATEFRRSLDRAIELAEARLQKNPNDLRARFDKGAAYGVLATYVASVEGSMMSAFRLAKRSYDAQETVLDRDPARVSAGLVVGTYRYVVSTLPLHMRMLAYVVGFGGGKERGIQLVEAAAADPNAEIDAKSGLIILYSREGRHEDAMRLARELSAALPRNRLLVLEEGAAAIRAGRHADAEAVLSRGLAVFEQDPRPKLPGELALWLYKRGFARLELNRRAPAADDFRRALAAGPAGWVEGRIHLDLGRLADLDGRRADAVSAYRTARAGCQTHADKWCADLANRYMRQPYAAGRQ